MHISQASPVQLLESLEHGLTGQPCETAYDFRSTVCELLTRSGVYIEAAIVIAEQMERRRQERRLIAS